MSRFVIHIYLCRDIVFDALIKLPHTTAVGKSMSGSDGRLLVYKSAAPAEVSVPSAANELSF